MKEYAKHYSLNNEKLPKVYLLIKKGYSFQEILKELNIKKYKLSVYLAILVNYKLISKKVNGQSVSLKVVKDFNCPCCGQVIK